jgi:hypothetical protein
MGNFGRELRIDARAGAKTGLTVCLTEFKHQN